MVEQLLAGGSREAREAFYAQRWNTWRWRVMFRVFFSRAVMGRLGRDPAFFTHVEGSVAERILQRTRHALTVLDPSRNPYVHWILAATHGEALPLALRPEHFDTIRQNLDWLEWRQCDVGAALDTLPAGSVHGCNLSDIFEYMSLDEYRAQLERLCRGAGAGGAAGLLEHAGAAHASRGAGRPIAATPRSGRAVASAGQGVLLSRLRGRGAVLTGPGTVAFAVPSPAVGMALVRWRVACCSAASPGGGGSARRRPS